MTKIDRLLNKEKERIDNLDIPRDMEDRLRSTLNNVPEKKKKSFKGRVAALIVVVLLLTYNMDTLAYYGRRLVGYENVMNGTLKELNELGKGQLIDKSYTFKNGVEVILDAIMLDYNTMIMFYTIISPEGKVREAESNMGIINFSGFGGRYITYGGQGEINDEGTEMRWIIRTHEAPRFFEKNIKMELTYTHEDGEIEQGEINFKIDRSQAVGKSIKMNINKNIELGNRKINIKSLVASPTSTKVKGKTQNILELGLDVIRRSRIRPENIEMILIADGKEVDCQGSGMSSDMKGSKYEIRFDTLPKDTEHIELRLLSFAGDEDVNEEVDLNNNKDWNLKILDQEIKIENVYEENGNTYVEFTTEESTYLSKVYIHMDGKEVKLEKTLPGDFDKVIQGDKEMLNYTRTMEFKGRGDDLKLVIEGIRYNKSYDELIYSY